ncbi:MAG: hypothetical protein LBL93_06175 [Ruminococcus sp.]|jgi:hypothetical protein|nr:hypothetical protein [Ruminococcus sp.]
MNKNDLDQAKLSGMLEIVSKKLGKSPEELKSELESGKFDEAFAGMNKRDNAILQKALNNPKMVERMMNSRQAQSLYEKLCK